MRVSYKPSFLRDFKRLPKGLQEEVREKIELLKEIRNHKLLRVHKLKGKLKGFCSFSVNYKVRIIFMYISKTEIALMTIGDHVIYQ